MEPVIASWLFKSNYLNMIISFAWNVGSLPVAYCPKNSFESKWDFLQSFKKYMTFKKDYNELVLYLLRGLVKDALHFEEIVSGSISGLTHIDVKVEELQSKVMKLHLFHCRYHIIHRKSWSTIVTLGTYFILSRHRIMKSLILNHSFQALNFREPTLSWMLSGV